MSDFIKKLLGFEDVSFDTSRNNSTFSRTTSTGGSQNIKKINANHIPVLNSLTWGSATTVQDFLVLAKALRDDYDAFVADLGHWANYLGPYADGATLIATYPDPTVTPGSDDVFAWVDATKSFWHWDQSLGVPAWVDSYRTEGLKELTAPTELTLATGVATQTQIWHRVDTEANAATDDLDKINRATGIRAMILQLENSARVVTLKHAASGTDKFLLPSGLDIEMLANKLYLFFWDDNVDMWRYTGEPEDDGAVDIVTDPTPELGGPLHTNGNIVYGSQGADIPSNSILILGTDGNTFKITGPIQIDEIQSDATPGTNITLIFESALTFAPTNASLAYPLKINAGDILTLQLSSTKWEVIGLSRPEFQGKLQNLEQQTFDLQPSGTTQAIDWSLGNSVRLDLDLASGNVTLTLTNPIVGQRYLIYFIQGTVARTVTFPAAVIKPGGASPITLTISVAASAKDVAELIFDGTNYFLLSFTQAYS